MNDQQMQQKQKAPKTKTNPVISEAKPVNQPWVPTQDFTTYSQVPFFRKFWFALVCILIFTPALLAVLLSGDVYRKDIASNRVLVAAGSMRGIMYMFIAFTFILGLLNVL